MEKSDKKKIKITPKNQKWTHPIDNDGRIHSSNMG